MKIIITALLLSASLYGQWMTGFYAAQNGALPVSSIPWSKYSHIIHFAAAPNADGSIDMHYLVQNEISAFASRPAGKKVLVAIKDQDSNLSAFGQATSPSVIAGFVNNIVNFVNNNGYDGLDIDWEANVNVTQFNDFLSRLRSAMPNKIIVMDGGDWNGMNNVAAASQSKLDQINVMCYDMDNGQNCNGQDCSWHNDALMQNGQTDKRTCDARVRAFTSLGVANSKIGIGVPFYVRRRTGVTQEMVMGSFPSFTMNYRDLVNDSSRWQSAYKKYDSGFKADYLSIPSLNEFISYNGTQFMTDAVAWQKAQGFGGFMTFTVDQEYLSGQSGDAAYPMSSALYNLLFGGTQQPPPPPPGGPAEPVRSGGSPSGALSSSTTTTTISLSTNVNSTCAYSTLAGVPYGSMPYLFSTTGGTAHSVIVVSLLPGTAYNYYVKCTDGTANTTDYPISFSIAAQSTGTAPVPFLVTPSSGTGSTQSFTFQVSDSGGWASVQQLDSIFDTAVSKTNSCWVEYWAPTKTLSLKGDDNVTWTAAAMGSSTVLRNSQCSVNPAASSAGGSGTTMTLALAMSFNNAYSGTKSIVAFAGDQTGLGSGWQTIGSWTVPWTATTQSTPPVVKLSPNVGSGASPTFKLQITDAAGAGAVTQADLFIGTAAGAANSCWVEYEPAKNIVTLRTDNNASFTQATVGTKTQLSNSQCTVDAYGMQIAKSGNSLIVTFPINFNKRFKSTNQLLTFAADATLSTGWQNMGTWTR